MSDRSYLADTSAWHIARRDQQAGLRVWSLSDGGQMYTCAVVAIELGVSARNQVEHDETLADLRAAAKWLDITPQIERRALAAQRELCANGFHRAARLADLVIAATAAVHDLTVLHYDTDYDLIGQVTGWPSEWIAPKGSL